MRARGGRSLWISYSARAVAMALLSGTRRANGLRLLRSTCVSMHARDGAAPTIVSDSQWPNCPRESTVFGRCEMDTRMGMRGPLTLRPFRLARCFLPREGGVERHGRPRAGLQPFRPVRAVGFVLVGREPQSPFQLAADGGLVPADQPGRSPDAQTLLAMQPLDPDPLVRGQVRITCTHECNTSSWNLDTSNPRQVLHFYPEPAGRWPSVRRC